MKEFGRELPPQPLNKPEDVLNNLLECLLISFCYSQGDKTLTIVSDYPFKSAGSMREFIAIVFSGVSDFEREKGDRETALRFDVKYETGDDSQAVVVQSVHRQARGGKQHLAIWFGPSFGGFSFSFVSLSVYTRGAVVTERNGIFQYRDAVTNEPFDFYRPFQMR